MFQVMLDEALGKVDGALACSLVGLDGIPVEVRTVDGAELDPATLSTELSSHVSGLLRTVDALHIDPLGELSLCASRLWMIARMVNRDYFLALFLRPGANLGKGRYLLRQLAPRVRQEL